MTKLLEQARMLLSRSGLRRTPGRVAMLRILLLSGKPLTPQEILDQVSSTGLNRVSVYRGLHSFMEVGLVHRIEAGDRLWRFAVCLHGNHKVHCHPHFTCRSCGQVECLSEVELPALKKSVPGYRVEEQEIYMKGLCPDCNESG